MNQVGWLTWLVIGGVAGWWLAGTIMRARLGPLVDTVAVTAYLDPDFPQVPARH